MCSAVAVVVLAVTLGAAAVWLARVHVAANMQRVHVRYVPGVSVAERMSLEGRLGLVAGLEQQERTWSYLLEQRSHDRIKALVSSPLVEDTHNIDRASFRIVFERPDLPPGLRWLAEDGWLPWVAGVCAAFAAAVLWLSRRDVLDSGRHVRAWGGRAYRFVALQSTVRDSAWSFVVAGVSTALLLPLAVESKSRSAHSGRIAQRRSDIQGLRALAVLMVVAFHAGLPIPGGFTGVDVFFVISGFVITATLDREFSATGRIRFGSFYLRRFKRLAPALALMTTAVVAFSMLTPSPLAPLRAVTQTALGASLLSANIVIARMSGGYFDPPAESNPLLNTWSLSVEEQFYLVFPLVLTGGWLLASGSSRYRAAPAFLVRVVALASFGLALFDASAPMGPGGLDGFYSPLTRAWEFAVGAFLALSNAKDAPGLASRQASLVLGSIGVAFLLASLWLVSGDTPHPGVWTLLPVTGTMLLIAVGTARQDGTVTRVLSTPSLVWIGDWSYSLYLWHWPFIVFAGLFWPGEPWALVLAGLASVAPALASYYWVEQPFRRLPQRGRGRGRLAAVVVTTLAIPLLVSGFAPGLAARWLPEPAFEGHDAFFAYIDSRWFRCPPDIGRLVTEEYPRGKKRCFQSQRGDRYDAVLVGDSHAEHLFPGLAAARPGENILALVEGSGPFDGNERFAPMIEFIRRQPNIRTVIYAFWERRLPAADANPEQIFANTLSALHTPGRRLILVEDVPSFSPDVTDCVGNAVPRVNRCSDAVGARLDYMRFFRSLSATDMSISAVSIRDFFCQRRGCRMDPAGAVLYRDPNHLNVAGSMLVAPAIVAAWQE